MTLFASVQASVAQPFFDAVPLPLSKVERLAEDAGLPGSIVSQPRGIISLRAAEKFMVKLDRRINHPTFFFRDTPNTICVRADFCGKYCPFAFNHRCRSG
ncbi:hypothetical protein [Ruegeria arenilitoris]|uniref:hypothetical protein n=1 Tax=Ruegeria arenilitoris TaxID=1173585 RepID=UPI00147C43A8|nr:hypothetical protein [Ruegeria arenilitoris]